MARKHNVNRNVFLGRCGVVNSFLLLVFPARFRSPSIIDCIEIPKKGKYFIEWNTKWIKPIWQNSRHKPWPFAMNVDSTEIRWHPFYSSFGRFIFISSLFRSRPKIFALTWIDAADGDFSVIDWPMDAERWILAKASIDWWGHPQHRIKPTKTRSSTTFAFCRRRGIGCDSHSRIEKWMFHETLVRCCDGTWSKSQGFMTLFSLQSSPSRMANVKKNRLSSFEMSFFSFTARSMHLHFMSNGTNYWLHALQCQPWFVINIATDQHSNTRLNADNAENTAIPQRRAYAGAFWSDTVTAYFIILMNDVNPIHPRMSGS